MSNEVPRGPDGLVRRGKGGKGGGWWEGPCGMVYAKGTGEDRQPGETERQWYERLVALDATYNAEVHGG